MAKASSSRSEFLLLAFALCSISFAQSFPAAPSSEFARGVTIEKVITLGDPLQSYALFLPSYYSPSKKWPIIYAFDPVARGKMPVEMLKAAAEKYGYILAGSNNSRNGPVRPSLQAAQELWTDTHKRLSVDDARVYATGFSGGARFATSLALLCKCITGIFANGAGFPAAMAPATAQNQLLYFGSIGEADFNHPEMVQLQKQLDDARFTNRIRHFEGEHEWAPADVALEAVEWFELQAMRKGLRAADQEFISREFAQGVESAKRAEASGDVLQAAYAYKKIVQDFQGLREVNDFAAKLAALEQSKAYNDAQKRGQDDIRHQSELTQGVVNSFSALKGSPDEMQARLAQLRTQLSRLRASAQKSGAKIEKRALNQVAAMLFETGETDIRNRDLISAINDYDLLAELVPDSPGSYVQKARAYAVSGDKKRAISNLRKAVDRGFKNLSNALAYEEFSSLRQDSEFKKLLSDINQSPEPANK
jgi:dienelactone hydrolase